VTDLTDRTYLRGEQYRDGQNLNARVRPLTPYLMVHPATSRTLSAGSEGFREGLPSLTHP
jgi:hypothetical protein